MEVIIVKTRIAIYARLSKDDGSRYSSIEAQEQLAKEYIKVLAEKLSISEDKIESVMYVDDKMLKKDEYEKFLDFSGKYQKKFEKATVNIVNSLPDAAKWIGVFLPVVYPAAIYGLISGGIAHKKIKDQQYRCLTMALYLDGLQKFLEG